MTDEDLEQAFRDGLRRAADRADTEVPLARLARAGVSRRRRQRWVVGAVAAAVVAVAGVAVAVRPDAAPGARRDDPVVSSPSAAVEPVGTWRSESWRGLTVDVPADWGWGTAPVSTSVAQGAPYLCGGPGQLVRADGRELVNPAGGTPWVGRPIMLSDVCLGEPYPTPEAPYVWLGADVEPGVVELGDGYVQETVETFGTTLTVATDDPALRQQIIDSAQPTVGCPSRIETAPRVDSMLTEGMGRVDYAQLCAYARGGFGFDLTYAVSLDAAAATATHVGVYAGQRQTSPELCDSRAELVTIMFVGEDRYGSDPVTQDVVIAPQCQEVQGAPGQVSPLADGAMLPWSRNGLQAVLRTFIGGLG